MARGASTLDRFPIGSMGSFLFTQGQDPEWMNLTDGSVFSFLDEEFLAVPGNWTRTVNGGSASTTALTGETSHPGIASLGTGTNASGRAALSLDAGTIRINTSTDFISLETQVRFPVLSLSTQEFAHRIGLGDTLTGDFANGIYFEYNRAVTTTNNFIIKTANGSVRTSTTISSLTLVANTWYKLRFELSGGVVTYFINGNQVGTISTNIPTNVVTPVILQTKSVGTTARLAHVDYFKLLHKFGTAR